MYTLAVNELTKKGYFDHSRNTHGWVDDDSVFTESESVSVFCAVLRSEATSPPSM